MNMNQIYLTDADAIMGIIAALILMAVLFSIGFLIGVWKGVRDERKEAQSMKKPYRRPEKPIRVVRVNGEEWEFKGFRKKRGVTTNTQQDRLSVI